MWKLPGNNNMKSAEIEFDSKCLKNKVEFNYTFKIQAILKMDDDMKNISSRISFLKIYSKQ